MPLLPSHILLQTYSLTLALTSYILLSSPSTLLNATPLWLLGESMHIKPASFTSQPQSQSQSQIISNLTPSSTTTTLSQSTTELLSLLSLILLLSSLTQSILCTPLHYSTSTLNALSTKSLNQSDKLQAEDSKSAFAEKLYNLHSTQTIFLTLSAVRVLLEGFLVAWIYLFHSTRSSSSSSSTINSSSSEGTSIMELLANQVVFSLAMADMLFWGYLWTVLREEGREVAGLVGKRRGLMEEAELKGE